MPYTFVPVSIATTTTRESVPIAHIRAGLHQYRTGEHAPHVNAIADDIAVDPDHLESTPIVVVRAGGVLTLADGHHRTAAAKKRKLTRVPALIYDVELPPETTDAEYDTKTGLLAMELAAHFNRHDKMPRKWSNADKQRLGLAMLAAAPELSDMELSRRTGGVVSNVTFATYRKQSPDLQSDTRKTSDGRIISAMATGGHQPRKLDITPVPVATAPYPKTLTLTPEPDRLTEIDELLEYIQLVFPTVSDSVTGTLTDMVRECVQIAGERATSGMVPAPAKTKTSKPGAAAIVTAMRKIDDYTGPGGSLNKIIFAGNLYKPDKYNFTAEQWAAICAAATAKKLDYDSAKLGL